MVLTTCVRRFKTLKRLGFSNAVRLIKQRHKNATFSATWRKKSKSRTQSLAKTGVSPLKSGHTWHDIAQQQGCTPSFEQFFNQQCARSLPALEPLFASIADDEYIRRADEYVRNEFAILGSEKRVFDTDIPWHEDIRLTGQDTSLDAQFDATSWYNTITIQTGSTHNLAKDIKVPWELSRLQHLVVLGRAYTTTYDERYATTFAEHVRSWMTANPFLHGINWACPMEVALRATSLVIAFTSFRRSPVISDEFWLAYVTSLYDHMIYLENNWELYDLRTSNHYIADLVGYLYLCWFFNDCPATTSRLAWCHQELLAELTKQINPDGSSYEQATVYHRLVTELFYHHTLIAQQLRLPIPAELQQKFRAMCTYLQWCMPPGGQLITIGDNDSGVVTVAGLPEPIIAQISSLNASNTTAAGKTSHTALGVDTKAYGLRHFENVGLSIIKNKTWHVSLRHAVYSEQAPTSHLHNDATSITLAYNGVPFIVDPGSYVYTPSTVWRNLFRSVQSHSGMYLAAVISLKNSVEFSTKASPRVIPSSFACPGLQALQASADRATAGNPSLDELCLGVDSCAKNSHRVIPAEAGTHGYNTLIPMPSHHNALQAIEPIVLDDNIFLLRRAPVIMPLQETIIGTEKLLMHTTHDDYLGYGYRPERKVTLDEQTSTVTLHDQWFLKDLTTKDQNAAIKDSSNSGGAVNSPLYACFQFVLHPDVKATKITKPGNSGNHTIWLLEAGGITLEISSDQLVYDLRPAWYSPEYGVKVATQMLFARYELNKGDECNQDKQFQTRFRLVSRG